MPRPRHPHLITKWNISVPAPLAARVEHLFLDPLTKKPQYGERGRIVSILLEDYLKNLSGKNIGDLTIVPLIDAPHIVYLLNEKSFSFTELRDAVFKVEDHDCPRDG